MDMNEKIISSNGIKDDQEQTDRNHQLFGGEEPSKFLLIKNKTDLSATQYMNYT